MKKCEVCGCEWEEDQISWKFEPPDLYIITSRQLEASFIKSIIEDAEKRMLTEIYIDIWLPTNGINCSACAVYNVRALNEAEVLAITYKNTTGTYVYFSF